MTVRVVAVRCMAVRWRRRGNLTRAAVSAIPFASIVTIAITAERACVTTFRTVAVAVRCVAVRCVAVRCVAVRCVAVRAGAVAWIAAIIVGPAIRSEGCATGAVGPRISSIAIVALPSNGRRAGRCIHWELSVFRIAA